jgi:hypothetical protein
MNIGGRRSGVVEVGPMGTDGAGCRGHLVVTIGEDDNTRGGGPSVAARGAAAARDIVGDFRPVRGAAGVGVAWAS